MTDKADLLAQLAAIPAERQKAVQQFDARESELVAALREAGVTWDDIAAALGTRKQNAHRKYGPKLEETRTVRVRAPKETP